MNKNKWIKSVNEIGIAEYLTKNLHQNKNISLYSVEMYKWTKIRKTFF